MAKKIPLPEKAFTLYLSMTPEEKREFWGMVKGADRAMGLADVKRIGRPKGSKSVTPSTQPLPGMTEAQA